MHYQYVVTLKKDSGRATDLLSFLMCLFSGVSFLFAGLQPRIYFLLIMSAVLLIGLAIQSMAKGNGRRERYRYLLLLAAMGWIGMPILPWLGAIFLLLVFLEHQTRRPLEIGFDHDRVVINSLIRRQYEWSAFSNVVLRDGLLTLDFKNNRLLQKEVLDDEDEDDADEEEFNDYCKARL